MALFCGFVLCIFLKRIYPTLSFSLFSFPLLSFPLFSFPPPSAYDITYHLPLQSQPVSPDTFTLISYQEANQKGSIVPSACPPVPPKPFKGGAIAAKSVTSGVIVLVVIGESTNSGRSHFFFCSQKTATHHTHHTHRRSQDRQSHDIAKELVSNPRGKNPNQHVKPWLPQILRGTRIRTNAP